MIKVDDGIQVSPLVAVRTADVGVDVVVAGSDFRAEEGFNGKTFDVFMSEARADASGERRTKRGWQRISVESEVNARLITCPGVGPREKAQASDSSMNGSGENF